MVGAASFVYQRVSDTAGRAMGLLIQHNTKQKRNGHAYSVCSQALYSLG